ncbi:hypothetical protein GLOIN_2v1043511 [Rhizophagus irregularis DAOM 181602=DAOM 197198]|nr:hypothetical protein GLOIN_2v1043511 [Rhizophagus irregularis DAOM 181602=DAOM 197198]
MERILPNDFVLSAEYETLGLIDDDDDESVSDDDYVNEEDDDGDDEVWDGDEVDSDDDYDISGSSPSAFPIYLNKKKMDRFTSFLSQKHSAY